MGLVIVRTELIRSHGAEPPPPRIVSFSDTKSFPCDYVPTSSQPNVTEI